MYKVTVENPYFKVRSIIKSNWDNTHFWLGDSLIQEGKVLDTLLYNNIVKEI